MYIMQISDMLDKHEHSVIVKFCIVVELWHFTVNAWLWPEGIFCQKKIHTEVQISLNVLCWI